MTNKKGIVYQCDDDALSGELDGKQFTPVLWKDEHKWPAALFPPFTIDFLFSLITVAEAARTAKQDWSPIQTVYDIRESLAEEELLKHVIWQYPYYEIHWYKVRYPLTCGLITEPDCLRKLQDIADDPHRPASSRIKQWLKDYDKYVMKQGMWDPQKRDFIGVLVQIVYALVINLLVNPESRLVNHCGYCNKLGPDGGELRAVVDHRHDSRGDAYLKLSFHHLLSGIVIPATAGAIGFTLSYFYCRSRVDKFKRELDVYMSQPVMIKTMVYQIVMTPDPNTLVAPEAEVHETVNYRSDGVMPKKWAGTAWADFFIMSILIPVSVDFGLGALLTWLPTGLTNRECVYDTREGFHPLAVKTNQDTEEKVIGDYNAADPAPSGHQCVDRVELLSYNRFSALEGFSVQIVAACDNACDLLDISVDIQ